MIALRKTLSLLISFVVLGASSARAATWTTIDVPGSISTQIFGINTAGDMVGAYADTAGVQHGFVLSGGNFTTIDAPEATGTFALGINDSGQVAGYYFKDGNQSHGFLLDGTNFLTLDFPGALLGGATGINNSGQIVGTYVDADHITHGYEWISGTFATMDVPGASNTIPSGVNNLGYVVGMYADINYIYHGFMLSPNGSLRDLGRGVDALGINDYNVVVGIKGYNGFILSKNSFTRLRFRNARYTWCFGVNGTGEIAGTYNDPRGVGHGFLRTR